MTVPGIRWPEPERNTDMDALLTDALTKLGREECATGMEQSANYAAVKDVQTWLVKEEFVPGMEQEQSAADAVEKDAQARLPKEECALDTGQRANGATVKAAQTVL